MKTISKPIGNSAVGLAQIPSNTAQLRIDLITPGGIDKQVFTPPQVFEIYGLDSLSKLHEFIVEVRKELT